MSDFFRVIEHIECTGDKRTITIDPKYRFSTAFGNVIVKPLSGTVHKWSFKINEIAILPTGIKNADMKMTWTPVFYTFKLPDIFFD